MSRRKKGGKKAYKVKSRIKKEVVFLFEKSGTKPLNYKQISSALNIIDDNTRKMVLSVLYELVEAGVLLEDSPGKFKLTKPVSNLVTGEIEFIKSGAAYVIVPESTQDIYIPVRRTGKALPGDLVSVNLRKKKRGKPEGEVVQVVERSKQRYVGILDVTDKFAFVICDHAKMPVDLYIPKEKLKGAKHGEKVIAQLRDWPDGVDSPYAEIVEVLGTPGENNVEIHAILHEYGLPVEFPDEVLAAANALSFELSEEEFEKRRDFREITTFTIDPTDAKDFDDALSFHTLENGNYEIGVHIADVSHYVQPNTILDKEARERGNSIYLVDVLYLCYLKFFPIKFVR